jgi:DNA-binding response OmpR family regulator
MPRQALAPRILIVMEDQWPRAMLRAALIDAGYDAIGARTTAEALGHPVTDPERGPVRLVVVDEHGLEPEADIARELAARFDKAALVLIAPAGAPVPTGAWNQVIRRPVSIGELVTEARRLVPLAETASGSVE